MNNKFRIDYDKFKSDVEKGLGFNVEIRYNISYTVANYNTFDVIVDFNDNTIGEFDRNRIYNTLYKHLSKSIINNDFRFSHKHNKQENQLICSITLKTDFHNISFIH